MRFSLKPHDSSIAGKQNQSNKTANAAESLVAYGRPTEKQARSYFDLPYRNYASTKMDEIEKKIIKLVNKKSLKAFIKNWRDKRSVWVCYCGCVIPKKGAVLSGGPQYKYDYHVHCPRCGRTVAQFVNPKETQ